LLKVMKLSEIAQKIDCRMCSDSDMEILRVAGIDEAGPGDLTFVSNRKYISHIKGTRASAIILGEDLPEVAIPSLRTPNPYLAFARALELFYQPVFPEPGIHPTAVIAPDASIGPRASIGAYVVVGKDCLIGAGVILHPHAVLYPGVTIGSDTLLHSHVVVREFCVIGSRVTIQNGAVIGSDGFGFAPQEDGSYYKICQTGRVIIEDEVEIGANTTVDRAAVGDTIVRRGAKLDNLVQVGHGAQVGENSVIAAQVGLAGSTRVGRNVKIGGQAGLAGHLEVGDGAIITAQSGSSHDIPPGAVLSGSPAINNSIWLRAMVAMPRLPAILHKLRELEKEVARLQPKKNATE
jgi:UDP-3-O-[3-hydroxymyristoyl] glucosamine N-acyltransferase